jgi:hypothetical protein
MQRMRVEECLKIIAFADDVLAYGQKQTTAAENAGDLPTQGWQIARVVKHRSAVHDVEGFVGQRKVLADTLDNTNRKTRCTGEGLNCAATDHGTWIGLNCRHPAPLPRECIACHTSSGAEVENVARNPTRKQSSGGRPFLGSMKSPRRSLDGIVIEAVHH